MACRRGCAETPAFGIINGLKRERRTAAPAFPLRTSGLPRDACGWARQGQARSRHARFDRRRSRPPVAPSSDHARGSGACRRDDVQRPVGRRARANSRRSRLQHRDDGLPGDPHRSVVRRPDRHAYLSAHRQRRREPRGRGIAPSVRSWARDSRSAARRVELPRDRRPRLLPRGQRNRRDRRSRHPPPDSDPARAWRSERLHRCARFERQCRRRGCSRARAGRAVDGGARSRENRDLRGALRMDGGHLGARRRLSRHGRAALPRGRVRLRHQAQHPAPARRAPLPDDRRPRADAGRDRARAGAGRRLPVDAISPSICPTSPISQGQPGRATDLSARADLRRARSRPALRCRFHHHCAEAFADQRRRTGERARRRSAGRAGGAESDGAEQIRHRHGAGAQRFEHLQRERSQRTFFRRLSRLGSGRERSDVQGQGISAADRLLQQWRGRAAGRCRGRHRCGGGPSQHGRSPTASLRSTSP